MSSLQAANLEVERLRDLPTGTTTAELHAAFRALNALRKAVKRPEDLLADLSRLMTSHGGSTTLQYPLGIALHSLPGRDIALLLPLPTDAATATEGCALAAELLCRIVAVGSGMEGAAVTDASAGKQQALLATVHAWSCTAAAAVHSTKLRIALAKRRDGDNEPSSSVCCLQLCSSLWSSPAAGKGLRPEEIQWLAASMFSLGVPLAKGSLAHVVRQR